MNNVSDSTEDTGHILMLYDSEQQRDQAILDLINRSLCAGQLVIYASLDGELDSSKSAIASRIDSFKEHIENGNLRVIDMVDCQTALDGAALGFVYMIRETFEQAVTERLASNSSNKVQAIIVVGCVDSLTKSEKFEENSRLEKALQKSFKSWESKGMRTLLVCPHLTTILDSNERATLENTHTDVATA